MIYTPDIVKDIIVRDYNMTVFHVQPCNWHQQGGTSRTAGTAGTSTCMINPNLQYIEESLTPIYQSGDTVYFGFIKVVLQYDSSVTPVNSYNIYVELNWLTSGWGMPTGGTAPVRTLLDRRINTGKPLPTVSNTPEIIMSYENSIAPIMFHSVFSSNTTDVTGAGAVTFEAVFHGYRVVCLN